MKTFTARFDVVDRDNPRDVVRETAINLDILISEEFDPELTDIMPLIVDALRVMVADEAHAEPGTRSPLLDKVHFSDLWPTKVVRGGSRAEG